MISTGIAGRLLVTTGDVTSLFTDYPLTPEMLRRARVPGADWEAASYWRLLERLEAGEKVRVAVLGGSEAAGTGCDDGTLRVAGCSWSARFVAWLRQAYPRAQIGYENHGAGGTTTAGILPSLRPILEATGSPVPDLILIDFLVNDAFEAQDWLAGKGGAYANTEPTAMERQGHSRLNIVQATTSILLSRLQERHPHAALLLYEPLCTVEGAIANVNTKDCYDTQEAHVAAANAFRVPVVSYRDVVWPADEKSQPPKPQFWCCNDTAHPRWEAHQLMADTLIHAWTAMHSELCQRTDSAELTSSDKLTSADRVGARTVHVERDAASKRLKSLVPADLLERYDQCRTPSTSYDAKALMHLSRHQAKHPSGNHPKAVKGDWRLYEDRKDKPGWIAEEEGSILRFDLAFGASPRVVLTFLRSYEELGSVEVGFAGPVGVGETNPNRIAGSSYEIDGIWPEGTMPPGNAGKVSQVHSLAFNVQQTEVQQRHGDAAMVGFGIKPFSHRGMVVKVKRPGKFKILSIVSC